MTEERGVPRVGASVLWAGGINLYEELFENAPLPKAVVRARDLEVLQVNARLLAWSGHAREEIERTSPADLALWSQPGGASSLRAMLDLDVRGAAAGVESRLRLKDGSERRVEIHASAIDLDGEHCFLLTFVDIERRMVGEESSRRLLEQMRFAEGQARLGSLVFETGPRTLRVSPGLLELFALPAAVEPTIEAVLTRVRPEDRDRVAQMLAPETFRPGDTGSSFRRTEPIRLDSRFLIERLIEPTWLIDRDRDGAPLRVMGLFRDVTDEVSGKERVARALDRLARATAAGGVGTWEMNLSTGRVSWDEQMFIARGLLPDPSRDAAELHRRTLHPADARRVSSRLATATAAEGLDLAFRVIHADGAERFMFARGRVEADDRGVPVRISGTEVDVTPRVAAERRMAQSEARFRSVFESNRDALAVLVEPAWRFESVNPAFRALVASPDAQALAALRLDDLMPEVQPDGTPSRDLVGRLIDRAISDRETHVEVTLRTLDGRHPPVSAVFSRLEIDGRKAVLASLRDISAQHSAAAALNEANLRRERAAGAGDVGVWEYDHGTGTLYLDAQMRRRRGIPLDDSPVSVEVFIEAVVPEDREIVAGIWSAASASGFEVGYRMRVGDGAVGHFRAQGAVEFDDAGRIARISGAEVDVTALQRAAAALDAREKFQREILAHAGAGIIATTVDGVITLFNPEAERLTGWSEQEVVGKLSAGVFHDPGEMEGRARELSAELGEAVVPGVEALVAKARRGEVETREWTYVNRDGSRVPVLLSVSALRDAGGSPTGFLAVARDISALKATESALVESEIRLRAVLDHNPEALLVVDGQSLVRFANGAACDLFGVPRGALDGTVFGIPSTAGPARTAELDVAVGGRTVIVEMRIAEIAWGGEPTTLAALRDISAVRELERVQREEKERLEVMVKERTADLERASNEAERANRAKTEFLARMSHEIRTPMNAVVGMNRLLERSSLNDRQRELVGHVGRSAADLLRIINDILDFSKIEAGKMGVVAEEFDLEPLVRDIMARFAEGLGSRSVALRVEIGPGVPERVVGDPGRIRQVLVNLIGNGLKFTEAGEVLVRVTHRGVSIGAPRVRFDVADTGPGIPIEQSRQLFTPFEQVDGSHTRRHGGTGLGLAISRQLVELMDGRMGVETAEGVGSTFWFELKLPEATEHRHRVMLLRESPLTRGVSRLALERAGCIVEAPATGADALARLEQARFDAVMCDSRIADMTGADLAAAIRTRGGDLPGGRVPVLVLFEGAEGSADDPAPFDAVVPRSEPLAALSSLISSLRETPRPRDGHRGAIGREEESGGVGPGANGAAAGPVVDRAVLEGLRRLESPRHPDLVDRLVADFLVRAPARLEVMARAFAARDWPLLAENAHDLKAESGNLGARRLSVLCDELQIAARASAVEKCASILPRAGAAFADASRELGRNPVV